MANLAHWWPLAGDCKDYGYKGSTGSMIGSTGFNATGKIGKSLLADNGTGTSRGVNVNTNLEDMDYTNYSLSVWIKPNGNHYHYEGAIISSGNWNTDCWAFGVNQDNTKVDVLCNGYQQYIDCVIPTDSWTHLVCTKSGNTIKLYKNSLYINTYTKHGSAFSSDADNLCIGRETYANGYFGFNGSINDLRIYDGVISDQEICELYKCCVIDYNFNIPSYSIGTNYVSSTLNGGNTTKDGNDISTNGNDSDTYFYLNLYKALESSKQYTISCMAEGISSNLHWGFGVGAKNGIKFNIKNGYNKFTFTADSNIAGKTKLILDDVANTITRLGTKSKFYNFKIEDGIVATPFAGYGRTNITTVYDGSGYRNNGTSAMYCSEDSILGSYCAVAKTRDTDKINFSNSNGLLSSLTNCTVLLWLYPETIGTGGYVAVSDTSGSHYIMCSDNGTGALRGDGNNYVNCSSSTKPSMNNWNFFATTSLDLSDWNSIGINQYSGGSSYWGFTGKVAEFKVYATNLTQEQINVEYRSHTQFANSNSIHTKEFIEPYKNLAEKMNQSLFEKKATNGVSYYTQENCQISLTDKGMRIYRPANISTNTNYGGARLRFQELGNTRTVSYTNKADNTTSTYTYSDFLQKGHRYRICYHVSGYSNNGLAMHGFTNEMGWGESTSGPNPSNVIDSGIPDNFGIVNGEAVGAEKECFYEFTINDEPFKYSTYTNPNYPNHFPAGYIYSSYRDFQIGWTYTNSGALGTKVYISNIQIYDITNSDIPTQYNMITKKGITQAFSFTEDGNKIQISDGKTLSANVFKED